ncbi:MAG: nucleotidyl transferase AbiEii/AbiGii toxin family protein [Acidobacteria bacterium]|nr:nucleotidyl transferase AbiEii/AbiGii toxin family protein [Acidobacteriota bacterium]
MTRHVAKDVAASVRERLYQLSVRRNEDFSLVLTRFAMERVLYRVGRSKHRDRLVLKGAMLFHAWTETPHRSTRDLDFLGYGEASEAVCQEMIREICSVPDAKDGLNFDSHAVTAEAIREDDIYQGVRVRVIARLAQARIPLQIDIGFGDRVFPAAVEIDYPTLLEMPAPRIHAYSMESVIAEKIEAMVALGMLNSRMKDFYDVWFLARTFAFEPSTLGMAIAETFRRRETEWSGEGFTTLLADLGGDASKQTQWRAFLNKGRLEAPAEFCVVTGEVRDFVMGDGLIRGIQS